MIDFATLLSQLSNPLIAIAGISLLANAIPWVQDSKTKDWIKVLTVLLLAEVWAFALALAHPLPTTPDGWWTVVDLGLGVALGTQIFHNYLTQSFPGLGDFITQIIGKPKTIATLTTSTSTTAAMAGNSESVTVTATSTPAEPLKPIAEPGG